MIQDISNGIVALRESIKLIKDLLQSLPKGSEREKAEHELISAERSLKFAEAQVAQSIGYKVCRCQSTPTLMLFDKEKDADICPECGYEEARPHLTVDIIPPPWER